MRDQYADLRRDSRAAIVVPGGVEASLMKLFSDIAQTPSGHVKIVGSLEEAESWCMGID